MIINFNTNGGDVEAQAPSFQNSPSKDVTLTYSVSGDLAEGRLVKSYSALRVMSDGTANGARNFTTSEIQLDPDTSVELVLQPSYDRSMNLIINDRKTYPKLINAGFIVKGSKYEITNEVLYDDSKSDFNDQISLFNVNRTFIPTLEFEGISTTGSLPAGNYFYYFKLTDFEGNSTDIVEESRPVFVAKGSGTSTAGGDTTNKAVEFSLSGIESTRYKFVEVLYERFTGEGGAISNAFQLDEKFPVNENGVCNIFHSGQEAETLIDPGLISTRFTVINKAQSITHYNNRLFLANVELESEKFEALAEFAQAITVEGVIEGEVTDRDFYTSPDNIYHELGYWQLEYYATGIVYLLKTGGLTPSFAVTGITRDITNIYELSGSNFANLAVDARNGWRVDGGVYKNSNGIIRTPKKNSLKDIIALDFQMPAAGTSVYEAIEDLVLGYFFVRADRRINDRYTFAQGYQVPTAVQWRSMVGRAGTDHIAPGPGDARANIPGAMMFGPRTEVKSGASPYDYRRVVYDENAGDDFTPDDYPIGEYQFFPAPHGYTQAAITNTYGEPFIDPDPSRWIQAGAWNVYFFGKAISKNKFAFYSNDYMLNSAEFEERYSNGISTAQNLCVFGVVPVSTIINETQSIDGRQDNIAANLKFNTQVIRAYKISNAGNIHLWDNMRKSNGSTWANSPTVQVNPVDEIVTVRGGINAPAGNPFSGLLTGPCGIWAAGEVNSKGSRTAAILYFNNEYAPYIGIQYPTAPGVPLPVDAAYTSVGTIIMNSGAVPENSVFMCADHVNSQEYSVTNINNRRSSPIQDKTQDHALVTNLPGSLANAPISVAYSDINSRVFKAISKRYNFGEVPTKIYGGDCYTGSAYVKVYRGASTVPAGEFFYGKDDGAPSIVNVTPNAGRVYLHMEIFTENNYNPHARQERLDVNSLEKSTFFPVTPVFSDEHALTTHVSYISNLGLSKTVGSSNFTFYNVNLPGRNTVFDARVYYTAVAVTDNFQNAFRQITGLQFKDYNRKYGPINKITDDQQNLIIVQNSAISRLQTNQQVVVENVLIGEYGVLPEKQDVITDEYGSRHYDSIVKSGQGVYGVDVNSNKIWKLAGNLQLISDNAIASLLYPWFLGLTDEESEVYGIASKDLSYLSNNVIATYDEVQNKVKFLIVTSDPELPTVNTSEQKYLTLCFNERLNVWESKLSYNPLKWFNLQGTTISIPATIINNGDTLSLWQHWVKNYRKKEGVITKLPYANFYGTQYKVMFEFVVTDDTQFQKILDNLKVIGNKAAPTRIIYTVSQDDYSFPTLQGSQDTLYLRTTDLPSNLLDTPEFNEGVEITEDVIQRDNSGITSNIIVANYDYVEDHAYINVGKSMLDATYASGRLRSIRDKAIKVRFEYDNPDYVYIQAIIAFFRTSVS